MGKSKQIDALAGALAKAQAQCKGIKKTGKNPHLKNEYATLDDIINGVRQPLADNGLAWTQLLHSKNGAVKLTTLLMHESGQWISGSVVVEVGEGNRGVNAIQALGSSITYMKRYTLSAMLGIASEVDDDGNGAKAPKPQRAMPQQTAPSTGARPLDPDKVRSFIHQKSQWQGDDRLLEGEPVTEKQVPHVATCMSKLFPNLDHKLKQKARHDTLHYLIGVTSTKDLYKAEATALLDWMKDQANAQVEAARILEAMAIEAGQAELPM